MSTLKYKVITNKQQYNEYCTSLEHLVFQEVKDENTRDEIELLTLLIEKWDESHFSSIELNPIQLINALMEDHHMKPKDLVQILDISKGYVSDILNYKKGLSKNIIRKLSEYFKVSQEAFNRPYLLSGRPNHFPKKAASTKKTRKISR